MRDSLEFLFRQRFRAHEAPVDPALWDAIQGQLAAGAAQPEAGGLEDLMRDRFQGHEMHVDPALWGNISAQLGHGVAAGTATGGGLLGGYGWAAAGVGAVLLAGSAYLFWPEEPANVANSTTTEQPVEQQQHVVIVPDAVSEAPTAPQAIVPSIGEERASAGQATTPRTMDRPTTIAAAPDAAAPMADTRAAGNPTDQADRMEGASGSDLVERIIEDVTTRVKEDVLARTASTPVPSTPDPEEDLWEVGVAPVEPEHLEPLMPNVFTPNGDGVNDTFKVINAQHFSRMVVKVFAVKNDRLVFSSTANEPWTGDGCEDGYYLVAVEAMTPEGWIVTKGQVVWLNREIRH